MSGRQRAAVLLAAFLAWGLLAAGEASAAPVLSVTTVAQPGGTVTVAGTGYGASEAVDVWLDDAKVATAVTNASGAFSGRTVPIPASTQPGSHVMTGVGRRTGTAAERVFVVRSSWYTERGGPARRGWSVTENTISSGNVDRLSLSWSAGSGFVRGEPAIRNGVMTFMQGTNPSRLVAVDAETGAPRFSAAIPYAAHGGPAMGSTQIYAVAGQQLRVYSYSGALLWTGLLGTEASTGPTYDGTKVYVGDVQGYIHAFPATCSTTRCARLWKSADGPYGYAQRSITAYGGRVYGVHPAPTEGPSTNHIPGYATGCATACPRSWQANSMIDVSGIAASNGLLWVQTSPNRIGAYPLNCASSCLDVPPVMTHDAEGGGHGDPAIGHGRVAATSVEALSVYSEGCRGSSCPPRWSTSTGGPFSSSPTIANRLVYVTDYGGNTHAYPLDCYDGCLPSWTAHSSPILGVPPVVVNGRVYQASESGVRTYALDAEGPERRARASAR